MRILLKVVLFLAVIGVVGLLGFAIFSDLPAPQREIELPVETQ
jgi:hypothetical protein